MRRLIALYLFLVAGIGAAIVAMPFLLDRIQTPGVAAAPAPLEDPVEVLAEPSAAEALAVTAAVSAEVEATRGFPVVRGGTASLEQTTAAILADLALVKDQPDAEGAAIEAMSAGAVAGLKGARGKTEGGPASLETLVAAALRDGQTDAQIDAAVNAAAGAGDLSVPAELVTPEGKVDTAVLLASLVTQAEIAAGVAEPVNPEDVIVGGAGVEVFVVTKASGTSEEAQFYTVGRGDSLGAIAQRFYGDAARYPAIFEANRAILSSPDRLRIGQRLAIPKLTGA
jgi:nucleoid-associated protein YgaU